MIAGLLGLGLALLLLGEALSIRGQLNRLEALPTRPERSGEPDAEAAEYLALESPGVALSPETVTAASTLARRHGWSVAHLIPGHMAALPAYAVLRALSPRRLSEDPLAPGGTAGHGVVATADVLTRAQPEPITDDAAYIRASRQLKGFAYPLGSAGAVVAPSISGHDPFQSRAALRALHGPADQFVLWAMPVFWALLAWVCFAQPWIGFAAVAALHLQLPIALLGGPIAVDGLWASAALRLPLELSQWLRWVTGPPYRPGEDPVEARRSEYTAELAAGVGRFFQPRRSDCPTCEGMALRPLVRVGDLYQSKPGEFSLERCETCGHVFQNPALNADGLAFYYRDFYDGLGERTLEGLFSAGFQPYDARAQWVRAYAEAPGRWLDVGCGHGHFCAHARRVFPGTRFAGLDVGPAVEEAARRRWLDEGVQGLLPDVVQEMEGHYDVLSMSHALEHVPDPKVELAAAARALAPDGLLFIEVPDPEFPLGLRLGRYWMPWLQPQHLNLLPISVLERALEEVGLEVVDRHRAEAHVPNDLAMAVINLGSSVLPRLDRPWRRPDGPLAHLVNGLGWVALSPLVALGAGLDRLLASWFTRGGVGNTYRVLARRPSSGDAEP